MSDRRVVALIDDDDAVLDSLKFVLELDGYNVAIYSSAKAFLRDGANKAACLIVDQHMPGMTGLELIARLRNEGTNVPALLVTGMSSPNIVSCASRLGAEVLEKPPTEHEVLKFIDAHL